MRREQDKAPWWRVLIRENAYRDVWLILISFVLMWAAFASWDATQQANDATSAIQQQRIDATRRNCLDQNLRHDTTLVTLDGLIDTATSRAQSKEEKKRVLASVAGTKALIEALAPKRDCDKVVAATVQQPPGAN